MATVQTPTAPGKRLLTRFRIGAAVALVAIAALASLAWWKTRPVATVAGPADSSEELEAITSLSEVRLDASRQVAIGLQIAKAETGTAIEIITAPGRVTPDETRYAHITSRAAGVVRSVAAQIGQDVEAGELLATLDSPEVAQARFDLLTKTQELEVAEARADWQEGITRNTLELIERLKSGDSPDSIQKRFEGRIVGENREKLLTAESQYRVTKASMTRNKELLASSAVSQAQYQLALAEYEAAMATYQSLMDRMGAETRLANTRTHQDRRAAETAMRVARGRLRALGVPLESESVPELPSNAASKSPSGTPSRPEPTMSTYEIRSPFAGTILDREMIVPGVPIDTTHRIFLLADLATVWVEASVHESDFDLLNASRGGSVAIRSPAFPGRTFAGTVLYAGDLVDEKSRTVKLLARADNTDRMLKPGMFVEVEVRGTKGREAATVPDGAVLTSGRTSFVFVRVAPERFARREVVVGGREKGRVTILSGLNPGEEVVAAGAFKLKAEQERLGGGGA